MPPKEQLASNNSDLSDNEGRSDIELLAKRDAIFEIVIRLQTSI